MGWGIGHGFSSSVRLRGGAAEAGAALAREKRRTLGGRRLAASRCQSGGKRKTPRALTLGVRR